eukprot:CAMPEP_0194331542 /NCGR_PEP_ID=MMETSP0171-20130528/55920_1 /TAXON_ID=218684 /ORGANISM="Corethron pennatum, Strain L29A3" /LENGTH=80 /DNA_ID=CAMNT_0039093055 /DNA_START=25 /DNA_END=264 /DNA_ORIENTATION=+
MSASQVDPCKREGDHAGCRYRNHTNQLTRPLMYPLLLAIVATRCGSAIGATKRRHRRIQSWVNATKLVTAEEWWQNGMAK